MGMVSAMMRSSKPSLPLARRELIPRSERARLIDRVKFNGVVEGSRRSVTC